MVRKKLGYGVIYTFPGEIETLEDWVGSNLVGEYGYSFQGLSENDEGYKSLRVLFKFELADDRESFRGAIKRGLGSAQGLAGRNGGLNESHRILR